jgi:hypothetical protein
MERRQTFRRAALHIRKRIMHTKYSTLNVTISRIAVTFSQLRWRWFENGDVSGRF